MDPQVHEIRLAGPWESAISGSDTWERQKLPYQSGASGSVEAIRRRFHRPSGLLDSSRVLLVVDASGCIGTVSVNGQPVVQTPSGSSADSGLLLFDVTDRLAEFNTAEIQLGASTNGPATVVQAVRVRIIDHSRA